MRWPEKARKKKWPQVAYSLEMASAVIRTAGIALFFIIVLLQLKGWLETGVWPPLPVRFLLVDSLEIPFFVKFAKSYAETGSVHVDFFDSLLAWFLGRFPLSIFILVTCKLISMYIFWFVDHLFPNTKVQVEKGFAQPGTKMINFK